MLIKYKESDLFYNSKFNFNKHYDIIKFIKFSFDKKYDYFVRFRQDLNEFGRLKLPKKRTKEKKIVHNNVSEPYNELLEMYFDEYMNF